MRECDVHDSEKFNESPERHVTLIMNTCPVVSSVLVVVSIDDEYVIADA